MNKSLRVALVRAVPAKGDLIANYMGLMRILDQVAPLRPDVVVTPECFLDGYVVTEIGVNRKTIGKYAVDSAKSDYVQGVAAWAARHKCWVILGCSRWLRGRVANSALIHNRKGKLVGIYDKVSIKSPAYVAGKSFPVFASDFGKFGILICNDRHWPEAARTLALAGARIIFIPAYGGHGEFNDWMLRIRSRENEIPIVFTHPKKSLVTTMDGEIALNETKRRPLFSLCTVDLTAAPRRASSRLNRARQQFYSFTLARRQRS